MTFHTSPKKLPKASLRPCLVSVWAKRCIKLNIPIFGFQNGSLLCKTFISSKLKIREPGKPLGGAGHNFNRFSLCGLNGWMFVGSFHRLNIRKLLEVAVLSFERPRLNDESHHYFTRK